MSVIRRAAALPLALATLLAVAGIAPAQDPSGSAAAPSAEGATAAGPRVDRMVLCRDVKDREPVDEGTSFPADVGDLVCFTQILDGAGKTVYTRWYVGDRLVLEHPLNVGAVRWRCWSRKRIDPAWTGAARVDIATESGDVLASREFTLVAPAGQ